MDALVQIKSEPSERINDRGFRNRYQTVNETCKDAVENLEAYIEQPTIGDAIEYFQGYETKDEQIKHLIQRVIEDLQDLDKVHTQSKYDMVIDVIKAKRNAHLKRMSMENSNIAAGKFIAMTELLEELGEKV